MNELLPKSKGILLIIWHLVTVDINIIANPR